MFIEIEQLLKKNLNKYNKALEVLYQLIVFFSTSLDEVKASSFAKQANITEQTRCIMFRIRIDSHLPTRAYADIENFSYFKEEKGILFMFGCKLYFILVRLIIMRMIIYG